MLAGSAAGVVLLLALPATYFRLVVPYLILAACVLFGLQPVVARWAAHRAAARGTPDLAKRDRPVLTQAGVALGAAYGAYFGAALGIMLLAVLSFALDDTLQRINGLRSAVSLVVNTVAAICFLLVAPVAFVPVALMAGTSLVGGFAGAHLSKRLPAPVLRGVVVVFGVVTAARLLGA